MKINKWGRIVLQKKDLKYHFIYYKDFVIVNGNYLIHADYVEFESDLLQDKLNKREYFAITPTGETNFPTDSTFDALLKTPQGEPVRVYNLFYEQEHFAKTQLLTNLGANEIILMDAEFVKIMQALKGNITQIKNNKTPFEPVTVHHKNNELIGIFMPINNKTAYDEIFKLIADHTKELQGVA